MKIKRAEKKPRESLRIQEQSLKVKSHTIKQAGLAGANSASEQVEGGKELQNAALVEYMLAKPIVNGTVKSTKFLKQKSQEEKNRRIKRKKQHTTEKDTRSSTGYRVRRSKSNESFNKKSSEKKNSDKGKTGNRKRGLKKIIRKVQLMLLQKKSLEKDKNDERNGLELFLTQRIVTPTLRYLAIGLAVVALSSIPVFLFLAVVYNSPYAIFFPPLESGDTVNSVVSAYVAEFNQEVTELATNHTGYDEGRIIYVDYEGASASPNNYYDIISVYMVKHGMGDTATIINDKTKGWIKAVVDDMCLYTTSSGTEDVQNDDGTVTSKQVLYVNVELKDYREMINIYHFTEEQQNVITGIMASDVLTLDIPNGGQSYITQEEITSILQGITDEKQKAACKFALSKVGYPYSQEYRDSGNYFDCSSLAYYSWKAAGVNISYNGSTTAAAEAQGLEEAGRTVVFEEMEPGDLIFWSFCSNGRYKNISHVGIYVGNGKVVEAYDVGVGVIYGDISSVNSIVTICRPE